MNDMDVAELAAEQALGGPLLGGTTHSIVTPALSPAGLLPAVREFLDAHPFDRNVFGMTRFPDAGEDIGDPVRQALEVTRAVCQLHGLELHLASDRAMSDDLWANVAGHMWASRYGVAFFENRVDRGVNYNLTIEVGAMLMTGRRCALLKDHTVGGLPTDLVGMIYKDIDLGDKREVAAALHKWVREDLVLGDCSGCGEA